MKRIALLATLLFLVSAERAHAFIFVDLISKVQRIEMILQAKQYIDQIDGYRKEFDKYKQVFDKYFNTFHTVYKRLSSGDFSDFIPANWARLKDHFITIWKTFDEGAWQAQVLALRISPLYARD